MKGQITVFLSLVLTIIISVILTMVEGARTSAMQFKLDCAADLAMQSIFAEYHRELLNQYDLFFIDTSYGKEMGSYHDTESHFREYLSYNTSMDLAVEHIGYRDWFDFEENYAEIKETRVATDYFGYSVKEQAVELMKGKTGLSVIEAVGDWVSITNTYHLNEQDLEGKLAGYREKISDSVGEESLGQKVWKKTKLYQDSERPIALLEMELMGRLLKTPEKISTRTVNLKNYASRRDCNKGVGFVPQYELNDLADGILFGEYVMDKCGNFRSNTDKMFLKYQTEYIIIGGCADDWNLERVIGCIFEIRCAANYVTIMSDQDKVSEAELIGTALSALLCVPEAEKAVTQCIIILWAIAEGACDTRELLDGERIPLMKNAADFQIGISKFADSSASEPDSSMLAEFDSDIVQSFTEGLSYDDYLRLLLAIIPLPIKVSRFMDIVEMDIRRTPGNAFFRIDQCMDSVSMDIVVNSSYGQQFYIKRKYSYL